MAEAAYKPWLAGALVVCAIAMIGRNLVAPFFRGEPAPQSDPDAVAASTPEPTSSATPLLSDSVNNSSDTSRLSGWSRADGRDPFESSGASVETFVAESAHPPSTTRHAKKPSTLRIDAIAWGNGKMALVDGVPVRIGDTLAQGVLLDIHPDRLALRDPAGDTILRFREGKKP